MPLDYSQLDLPKAICAVVSCNVQDITRVKIIRRSIDARKGKAPIFVLQIYAKLSLTADSLIPGKTGRFKIIEEEPTFNSIESYIKRKDTSSRTKRPVVVGTGPSGLFAALMLAVAGKQPVIIEKGKKVLDRRRDTATFWKSGLLNLASNVIFGEGGAGTFSDGKLTSRSKDKLRTHLVLDTFAQFGAIPETLIDSAAHIGTDRLGSIIRNMRGYIEKLGGEFLFETELEELFCESGTLRGIKTQDREIECDNCILACGQGNENIYNMLNKIGVTLERKDFSVGVRLELPQNHIDKSQYGRFRSHERLGPAGFRLTYKGKNDTRDCYTFCMCPGGVVVPCASENGRVFTNGMSASSRNSAYGNVAFLVPVTLEDLRTDNRSNPDNWRSGLEFRKKIEAIAFLAGGEDYTLPASSLDDFIRGKTPARLPDRKEFPRVKTSDIRDIFPRSIWSTLKNSIPDMIKKITPKTNDIILYAAETRSSSPVRIVRDESFQSDGIRGLYPCGEGAGYAGGIVSSAIDGIRAAEAVLQR